MANQIQVTVVNVGGSPQTSSIAMAFPTDSIIISNETVATSPTAVAKIQYFYAPFQSQSYFVTNSFASLIAAANTNGVSQVQVTAYTVNGDPQRTALSIGLPARQISMQTVSASPVNTIASFMKTTYGVSETELSIIAASTSLSILAKNIIASASLGGLPTAMASPPTVTVSSSSTITGPTTLFTDPLYQYLGTQINTTSLGGYAIAGNINEGSYRGGELMEVHFTTDATAFEIQSIETGDKYRIFVNGQAVSLTPVALGSGAYTPTNIKVDFGSSAPRSIKLEFQRFLGFAGIKVPNNYSVWKTTIISIVGMIVGDSYTDAQYGDGTNDTALAFSRQVGFKLGITNWFLSGQSMEGYDSNGNNSGVSLLVRSTTDVVPYAPSYIIVCEGINDTGKPPAVVQANVTAFYNYILTSLPNTVITVVGPWRAPALTPATNIYDAVRLGVAAVDPISLASKRILYIDPTASPAWQSTGAGRVGAPSGVGNSNIYIGADSVHPVQAGEDYLASKVTTAALYHLNQLV